MPSQNEKVVIQQPPIRELGKKRSCIKRSCTTGCIFILLFFVGIFLLVKFVSIPRTKGLEELPAQVEKQLVLYDRENIDEITYTSGSEQHRLIETLAIIPKVVLSPIILNLENRVDPSDKTWQQFHQLIYEPITDTRDIYTVEWSELHASATFIQNYYETNLEKQNYLVENINGVIHFSKDEISGTIYITDTQETDETDYILLRVLLPT